MKLNRRARVLLQALTAALLVVVSPGGLAPYRAEPDRAAAQGSGNLSYAYDQLGRLKAVSDPSQTSGTAIYNYDAVGNLTSIARQSATQPAVLEFAPRKGPAGTLVTISGTGFSPCSGSGCTVNDVRFNGVVATVTQATNSQLTAVAPAGGTGTISVTVSGTTATSSASFTVGSDAPTITGFTDVTAAPNNGAPIAAAGATIKISGTNLETAVGNPTAVPFNTAANNVVALNDRRATVSQGASASQINAALPTNVSTGHLSVTTPGGTATTSGTSLPYFYVAPVKCHALPASYAPSDVLWVGTMATPTPSSASSLTINLSADFSSHSKVALVAFEGTAGQQLSLQLTTSNYPNVAVGIIAPDGTCFSQLETATLFKVPPTLPLSGTYTLAFTASGLGTSATLSLYSHADLNLSTRINAPPLGWTFTSPSQRALVRFAGSAGERIQTQVGMANPSNCPPIAIIQDHRGATVGTVGCAFGLLVTTLPATGDYAVVIQSDGNIGPQSTTPPQFQTATLTILTAGTATVTQTPTAGPSPTNTLTPSPTSTNAPSGSATPTFTPTRAPTATPLTGPALRVRPASLPPGGVASADWGGIFPPLTPTTSDWIGLYSSAAQADGASLATVTTTGGQSGQVSLPIPVSAPTGTDYEARLFNNAGTGNRLAVSNAFSVIVATATATLSPTTGPSPTRTLTPTAGPSPTPSASLSVRPSITYQGSAVSAAWTGIAAPTTSDWIGLYAPGAPHAPIPTPTVLTTGQASGQVSVPVPSTLAPGSYELRLFGGAGTTSPLATSGTFVVLPASAGGGLDELSAVDTPPDLAAIDQSASGPHAATLAGSPLVLPLLPGPLLGAALTVPGDAGPAYRLLAVEAEESWTPETHWRPHLLRGSRADSPWRALAPLAAAPGVTALAGQVLQLDGAPLADVDLLVGDQTAPSDATGRFLLHGLPPGPAVLTVDGRTADTPTRTYGIFDVGVDLPPGHTTVLPQPIWLSGLDTAHTLTIPSPATEALVLTTPRIPGLEVHLPAGTVIRDRDGEVVTELTVTALPQDRPPFPLPEGVYTPVYFTIQPGGATIAPYGARIVYPNYTQAPAGSRADFWHYEPAGAGWYRYGRGTVTADGQQVLPDPGTVVYALTGAMEHPGEGGEPPPDDGPPPGDGDGGEPGGDEPPEDDPPPPADGDGGKAPPPNDDGKEPPPHDGEPVDLSTGLFVLKQQDLALGDVIPVRLTRTYRPRDPVSRPFGIGATHPYEMYLYSGSTTGPNCAGGACVELILPDGGRVQFDVLPGCTVNVNCSRNAVYEHTRSGTRWYGARIAWNGSTAWHLTLRNGTVYVFADGTPLGAVRDRHGNQVTITRDAQKKITQITSPHGRWISLTYDTNTPPRIATAQDNVGRTVTYTYCDTANVATCGLIGALWKVTDVNGGLTQYTYCASVPTCGYLGAMRTVTEPRGSAASPQFATVTNEYNGTGRVSKQTEVDGSIWLFTYMLSSGKVTQTLVTDPRSIQRRTSFNTSGFVTEDIAAFGQCEQRTTTYSRPDSTNRVATRTTASPVTTCSDAPGRQTTYAYDAASGKVSSITRLAGTAGAVTTQYTYEPRYHRLASVTDPLGHTATNTYDPQGNLVVATDPLGRSTVLTYNPAGQALTVTDPLDHVTQLTYALGDLVGVTDPNGQTTRRFVDNAGRLVSTTNSLGQQTRREYDRLSRAIKTTDAQGQVTELGYDPNSWLTSVKDALNRTTSYTRDETNRVRQRTDPLTQSDAYTYDLNGNLKQVTDRRGKVTTYCYDNLDRRTFAGFGTITTPGLCAAGPNYESTIVYTYDKGDRLREANDSANGIITRTYDDRDRLTDETTPLTAPSQSVAYGYDAASRRRTMTVAGQADGIGYDYDAANRLTRVTQGSTVVGLSYDPAGRRSTLTLPNGVTVIYGYDAASQLTGITYQVSGSTTGALGYGYDAAGQRTSLAGTYARTGLPAAITSATYDANNRITNWNGTAWPSSRWDSTGNLLTDGTDTYSWNARNQLTTISGGTTASFSYDALGRRRGKTTSGTATSFLYDGLNAVQERVSGSVTANLLTGGLDEVFARTETSTTRALLTDALGSTVALVEPSGSVATQYTYEPFGKTMVSGTASANPAQFTGRENDGTGLYYYRARYYSPTYQRFVSEDPLGFGGGDVNLYAYAENNPTNFSDPLGLSVSKQPLPQGGDCTPGFPDSHPRDSVCAGGGGSAPRGGQSGERFNSDQQTVIEWAREGARSGMSEADARALVQLAREAGMRAHGPESHPNRPGFGSTPHVHVGPINVSAQ